jgi:hypothetical protein
MRKAGEVSFAQVFREAGGKNMNYRNLFLVQFAVCNWPVLSKKMEDYDND